MHPHRLAVAERYELAEDGSGWYIWKSGHLLIIENAEVPGIYGERVRLVVKVSDEMGSIAEDERWVVVRPWAELHPDAEQERAHEHGDSVGVHASDAANAWRNIARVSNPRNVVASLIVGAYHTGGQSERSNKEPYPFAEHFAEIKTDKPTELLGETETAIRAKDQFRAAALVARYGQLSNDPRPVFNLLLKFATSEDGALHAEKYYNTVSAEFAATRPAFRWGQLVALARVSASEYGRKAAGYEEGRRLLG